MISGLILQEKANYFARLLGKVNFECSESWIYRFRQRYDISVGKVCGTRVSRDECDNWLASDKWQESRRGKKKTQLEKAPASDCDTNSMYGQLGDHASQNTTCQDALVPSIKIMSKCCFCGEVQKDFFDVIDKPYVELASKKTTLTLNGLSIELDFKEGLDTLNESPSNNDGENNGIIQGSNNKAHENHKKYYISDSDFVTEAHKRKKNNQENSGVPKKRRASFDLKCLVPSLCEDNDESDIDNNEIKYKVDNNNEIDPLAMTDRNDSPVKELLYADEIIINVSREFTKDAHEDNGTIEIKEEINEMTDALDEEVQKQYKDASAGEADKMDNLDSKVNIIGQIGNNTDVVTELINENETVGAMPRSEFIQLVQSIVRQMMDK